MQWIVITGDYHFSDIKVAHPGSGQPYSDAYQTRSWVTPIYQVRGGCWQIPDAACPTAACQAACLVLRHMFGRPPPLQVMASGMTNSTARPNAACEGYRKESAGLRIEGDCGFVKLPAFGMLEFDWERRRLSMQIRRAEAPGGGQVLQALTISLDTCQPVDG